MWTQKQISLRVLVAALFLLAPAASAAPTTIPLDRAESWEALSFRKIPANAVSFGEDGLTLGINGSASPLVHGLSAATPVSRIRVRGHWRGALNLPASAVQGDTGVDDFVLKLGLVEAGDQTLNWFQRKIAAPWIRTLFKQAPKGSGVRRIHFLSTTQQSAQLNQSRVHPLSDLLYETRVTLLDAPGAFEMDVTLPESVDVLALWISADGDDTGSQFTLHLDDITLN
ncbi:MAG: hypothetical protein AB8G16_13235 [Gammaproteobacteria bacterium]